MSETKTEVAIVAIIQPAVGKLERVSGCWNTWSKPPSERL